MKYVNPDSPHTLDIHSEDQPAEKKKALGSAPRMDARLGLALLLGAGAIAALSAWAARRTSRSVRLRELKIEHLEVDHLQIKRPERANSSMEESGGVLRFELGSSDVFENGLE